MGETQEMKTPPFVKNDDVNRIDFAAESFKSGFSCSQSVLAAFCEACGEYDINIIYSDPATVNKQCMNKSKNTKQLITNLPEKV